MTLSASVEDYLEAILSLEETKKIARVRDIAESLSVKKPSVTARLKELEREGFIVYEPYGTIELTKKGRMCATDVQERHALLAQFLKNILGLSEEAAQKNACKMEHQMDKETVRRLQGLVQFMGADKQKKIVRDLQICLNKGETS